MEIAKNEDIGYEICAVGDSILTSEKTLYNLGCVFKKLRRDRSEQCNKPL